MSEGPGRPTLRTVTATPPPTEPAPEPEPSGQASFWARRRHHKDVADLRNIEELLRVRNTVLHQAASAADEARKRIDKESLALAATDLFVEKAQQALTVRGNRMFRTGQLATGAAVVLALSAAGFVVFGLLHPAQEVVDNRALILRLAQVISLGGFVGIAVKYLVSLSRAFFHEAVALYERRHALRFGRLYVHLLMRGTEIERSELEAAFDWNRQSRTEFQQMDAAKISETLYSQAVSAMASLANRATVRVGTADGSSSVSVDAPKSPSEATPVPMNVFLTPPQRRSWWRRSL